MYFQGEGQEKILLCKGDVFCQLNPISKKGPNAKMRKNCKKLSNIEKIFLARFAHSAFYKFIFLEQLTAVPQFNMQNVFFLSSHHDTNPLLHLYHFRKNIIIYSLILTVNHQGPYYPFFCLHPRGQTFLYPSKFCNHFRHSAK